MHKVLLVDDEVFVCKGLRSLIDWENLGYEICGEANNGEDAFEMIVDMKPEVVITDIRMPVVDGLELIKHVKEASRRQVHFIIISGYNDFSYAQKAVRYGVFDFVLKPIDSDELESVLTALKEIIDKETMEKAIKERLLFEHMVIQLLDGSLKETEMKEWAKTLNIDNCRYFYYLLLEMNNVYTKAENVLDGTNDFLRNMLQDMAAELAGTKRQFFIYEQQDNAVGMLVTSEHLTAFDGSIEMFANKLEKQLKQKSRKTMTVCVGEKITDLSFFKKSYETANSIRPYKYLFHRHEPIFYNKVMNIPVTFNELDKNLYISLMEEIEENNVGEIEKLIGCIFHEFEAKKFAPAAAYTTINRCIHGIIQTVNNMGGADKQLPSIATMVKWESYNLTREELIRLLTEFILEGANAIQDLRIDNMKGDIYKIKAYVEKNFHKNISLKSIAGKYYMNPVYMGQLFKKTFGIYFKEYLLKLRIDESKKLLRQTDARIYEVAEKVGFGSTDYFITQFEKMTGMTPTEYRKKLLNGQRMRKKLL